MTIEGRIAVDIGYTDIYTAASVQSVQRITLSGAETYSSGAVAIIAGTVGTAITTINPYGATGYKNAAGTEVTFSSLHYLAINGADVQAKAYDAANATDAVVVYSDGQPAVSVIPVNIAELRLKAFNGTSAYTLVLYGA
jgi:hypothetical protein